MNELQEFCRRVLGPVPAAQEAALHAERAADDRVSRLAAAAGYCRERADTRPPVPSPEQAGPGGLADAVADELASATARLPERQREVLALRELVGLSHEQIAQVMAVEPAAVAPLLARARLRLRAERRGAGTTAPYDCADGDRALRILARRQDSEPLSAEDEHWLQTHLRSCGACEVAHAAMLEASVCYRAWPRQTGSAVLGEDL